MNALLAFCLGQLSIVLLIFAFINFFIFGEPPTNTGNANSPRSSRKLSHPYLSSSSLLISQRRRRQSAVLRPQPAISTKTILKKTYYNVSGHQPESLDWFNVLIAQTIAQLRAEAQHDGAILGTLNTLLNGKWKPDFLGDINVTEINLGEEFPIFSNCRIIPVQDDGSALGVGLADGQTPSVEGTRLQARLDMDLNDVITLGIETKLVLNYPKPVVAVLPVALAVSVVRFRGTLSLSFVPSPLPLGNPPLASGQPFPTTLEFSFLPDYDLELSVRSLVGSRSRLQDLPKIAQLIEARLRAWFDERCVEPRVQQIVLPNFWPRKKNTRGGQAEDAVGNDDDDGDESGTEVERPSPSQKANADASNGSTSAASVADPGSNGSPARAPLSDQARLLAEGRKVREAMASSHRKPYKLQDPP